MLKALKPANKEKKRYLAYEIITKQNLSFKQVDNALKETIHDFLGLYGESQAGAMILPETYKNNKGIIRVNNKYVNHIKSALMFIQQISNKDVIVKTIGVSGIMKKAKEKYMRC